MSQRVKGCVLQETYDWTIDLASLAYGESDEGI